MKKIIFLILTLFIIAGCTEYVDNDSTFQDKFDNLQSAYKGALLATGKAMPDAADKFANFESVWNYFDEEYGRKAVNEYSNEVRWKGYMSDIDKAVKSARMAVDENNITKAHEELEIIREKWQELFERNDVDNMMYRMTAFHDTMEKTYEAAYESGETEIKENCAELKEQWKAVYAMKGKFTDEKKFQELWDAEQFNIEIICNGLSQASPTEAANALKVGYTQMYSAFG